MRAGAPIHARRRLSYKQVHTDTSLSPYICTYMRSRPPHTYLHIHARIVEARSTTHVPDKSHSPGPQQSPRGTQIRRCTGRSLYVCMLVVSADAPFIMCFKRTAEFTLLLLVESKKSSCGQRHKLLLFALNVVVVTGE